MDLFESSLIQLAQAGDRQAFGLLVEQNQLYVYNLALRVVVNPQEAEDLAQETFVRAWLAIANFRGQARLRTWLFRIVTNLCYNRLPGLRRELLDLGDDTLAETAEDLSPASDPLTGLEAEEMRVYLHQQIKLLPDSYRLLVVLRYQEDLSYEDIARVVSSPIGTVKTGLFRAKQRLREALQVFQVQEELVWMD